MHILKPLTIVASFGAVIAFAGAASAGSPANIELSHAQDATTGNTAQQIASTMRKVYRFEDLDRDHNGRLSRAELPLDMRSLRRDFVRADYSGDGQISPTEYVMYRDGRTPQYIGVSHTFVTVYSHPEKHEGRIAVP